MEELTTVYQYFAANGALIYVGITNRGTRRLHEHADSKPWWHLATGCTLEHFETRSAALAREAQLIQRYCPPYNTQHNPERDKPLEERAQTRLRKVRLADRPDPKTLKERRAAWYGLSRAKRLVAACVNCGQRPGITAPTCLPCRQLQKAQPPTPEQFRQRFAGAIHASLPEVQVQIDAILRQGDTRSPRRILASEQRALDALLKTSESLAPKPPALPETPERVAS